MNKRKLTACFISLNIRHYIMLMTKRYLSDLIEYIKRDVLENRSLLAKSFDLIHENRLPKLTVQRYLSNLLAST